MYIDSIHFLGVRYKQWKFVFTSKDTWLGPSVSMAGIPAVDNLQMDHGEQYDMVFYGAAPRTAGVLSTSPGRYSGADNGWTMVCPVAIVQRLTDSFKKYPNIPTTPGGASIGSERPEFVIPNMVGPEK